MSARRSTNPSSLPSPLLLLLSLLYVSSTTAAATSSPYLTPRSLGEGGIGVPLYRSANLVRRSDPTQVKAWLLREQNRLASKYDLVDRVEKRELEERATTALSIAGYGTPTTSGSSSTPTISANSSLPTTPVGMVRVYNQDHDTEYFASVGVGVPPQFMNVILDTGSADLWIASSNCTLVTGCNTTETSVYNASLTTTSVDAGTPFAVKYGSGSASGSLWQDFVGFGGYNVSGQTYALVDSMSTGLLSGNVSGLLGLGFQSLAASGAVPFWENLFQAGVLPFPGFSFIMSRFVNISTAVAVEPGGLMTLGYLNDSLFIPPINYIPIPSGLESYWVIPMDAVTVNGTNTTGVDAAMVAIDTGTTLVGGPSVVVKQVYAAIPGALAATGLYTGYYSYPCSVRVNISLSFGGKVYNITPDDFNLGSFGISNNVSTCLGAFFDLSLSSTSKISWVIGATFLKNVYSVFRASPAAVGFASLAPTGFKYNSTNSSVPDTIDGLPGGIYGPSGVLPEATSVPDSVTTAIQAGQTVSTMPSGNAGAGRGAVRWSWVFTALGVAVGLAVVGL